MSANQLIEKALSTTSEDEAIACLRVARKKNLKLTPDGNTLDKQIIQALYGREDVLSAERNKLRRELQKCELEKDEISKEIANYRASLIVTVICFSVALLFALVF